MLISVILFINIVSQVLSQRPFEVTDDVRNKLAVYYQGGYFAQNDSSPMNVWNAWSSNITPGKRLVTFELYPDLREYQTLYQTDLLPLANGQQSRLFSSWDDSTLELHFTWIQSCKIDLITVDRITRMILGNSAYRAQSDGMIQKISRYSVAFRMKFYVTWHLHPGWTDIENQLPADVDRVKNLDVFSSANGYAHQTPLEGGRNRVPLPVIGLRLVADSFYDMITNAFKPNYYVICGVPRDWMNWANRDNLITACDMIQQWGNRIDDIPSVMRYQYNYLAPAFEHVRSSNRDFQAVILAGYATSNSNQSPRNQIRRLHGDYLWSQFVNVRGINIRNAMIYSFDGFNDATAIAKAAEDSSMIPIDTYFLRLDVDGVRVSSDFYLRVTAEGYRMMNKDIGYRSSHEVPYVNHSICVHFQTAMVFKLQLILLLIILKSLLL